MSKPGRITVDVGEIEISEFDGETAASAIALFTDLLEDVPEEFRAAVRVQALEGYGEYGDYRGFRLWYERDETAEEVAAREDEKRKDAERRAAAKVRAAMQKEAWDRAEYARLREKYGP